MKINYRYFQRMTGNGCRDSHHIMVADKILTLIYLSSILFIFITPVSFAQSVKNPDYQILPFGEGGQFKMVFDRRQRPQSVFLNNKIHIVFNGGSEEGAVGKSETKPLIVTFDPLTRKFSDIVTLGSGEDDHHYCPVIWADTNDYLHVLLGGHVRPGAHVMSKSPGTIGAALNDWNVEYQIAPGISYPTFYRISENKEIVYYRTGGHPSSWTYRISDDNGKTWVGPQKDVTDLDMSSRVEWSSYHSVLPGDDGIYLHVAFIVYDDNHPRTRDEFERSRAAYNPRYKQEVRWKYNLYYVKIDLQTYNVFNFKGEEMFTPIDVDQANEKCLIWDSEWRVAGVPPDIVIDEKGNPAFLHVLSGESLEANYYCFIRLVDGRWKKTDIAPTNHQWSGGHISMDTMGMYHAYLIVGDSYLNSDGYMDQHGGGKIEEWISSNSGNSWERLRKITPDQMKYSGWKFNNIQAVTKPDGSDVEGMLLFYGWKDKNSPEAKAFLWMDEPDFSESVILEESFSYPDGELPPGWWSEGNPAMIKNGRLFVDADTGSFRVSTIWLDRKLSGNIRIEFEAHIVTSSDDKNNINNFLFYSDPSGKSLRETKSQREDAAYSKYHKLNGYIFTYLSDDNPSNARFRFRDNPGFNLLSEQFGFENKIGETYHIKILKVGNRFQYWVNGKKYIDKIDNEHSVLHDEGLFGFRTFHTALWWDNLKITQLD